MYAGRKPIPTRPKGVYEVTLASWLSVQIVVMREVDDQNWGFSCKRLKSGHSRCVRILFSTKKTLGAAMH